MSLTTDPHHPGLGHGSDDKPVPQNKVYLVLSDEERAKGFTRPYRNTYKHVGIVPTYPLRDLTDEEKERHAQWNYAKYEEYPRPNPDGSTAVGRFWTQADLDRKACNTTTTMGRALSETYARDPHFYGSTYCCTCAMHRPVAEFRWIEQDGSLGPKVGS